MTCVPSMLSEQTRCSHSGMAQRHGMVHLPGHAFGQKVLLTAEAVERLRQQGILDELQAGNTVRQYCFNNTLAVDDQAKALLTAVAGKQRWGLAKKYGWLRLLPDDEARDDISEELLPSHRLDDVDRQSTLPSQSAVSPMRDEALHSEDGACPSISTQSSSNKKAHEPESQNSRVSQSAASHMMASQDSEGQSSASNAQDAINGQNERASQSAGSHESQESSKRQLVEVAYVANLGSKYHLRQKSVEELQELLRAGNAALPSKRKLMEKAASLGLAGQKKLRQMTPGEIAKKLPQEALKELQRAHGQKTDVDSRSAHASQSAASYAKSEVSTRKPSQEASKDLQRAHSQENDFDSHSEHANQPAASHARSEVSKRKLVEEAYGANLGSKFQLRQMNATALEELVRNGSAALPSKRKLTEKAASLGVASRKKLRQMTADEIAKKLPDEALKDLQRADSKGAEASLGDGQEGGVQTEDVREAQQSSQEDANSADAERRAASVKQPDEAPREHAGGGNEAGKLEEMLRHHSVEQGSQQGMQALYSQQELLSMSKKDLLTMAVEHGVARRKDLQAKAKEEIVEVLCKSKQRRLNFPARRQCIEDAGHAWQGPEAEESHRLQDGA